MRKATNYQGKKFGLLTVMEAITLSDGTNNGGLWVCKCKCGKLITLEGYSLHHRNSCGCLVKKAAKKRGIANRNPGTLTTTIEYHRYKKYTDNPLSKNSWLDIASKKCYYCNSIDIRNRVTEKSYTSIIPLLDEDVLEYQIRVNSIVVVNGIEVSCCQLCKKMRGSMNHEEFIQQIYKVYEHLKKEC
jgi:hypothetical protein